jgi:hypothetical protein
MNIELLLFLNECVKNHALCSLLTKHFHLIVTRITEEELHAFFEKNTSFLMNLLVYNYEVMCKVVDIYGGIFGEKEKRFIPILQKMISENIENPLIEYLMDVTDLNLLIS